MIRHPSGVSGTFVAESGGLAVHVRSSRNGDWPQASAAAVLVRGKRSCKSVGHGRSGGICKTGRYKCDSAVGEKWVPQ
jgi:hypothetical protein